MPNLTAKIVISKAEDDLYFVLEKVDNENLHNWLQYVNEAVMESGLMASTFAHIPGIIPKEKKTPHLIERETPSGDHNQP